VTRLGWVADTSAEMATWSASIVPILVGGGTRIKIAEAFARGVPVVSTSLGAFGYPVENGRELLVADEPAAFTAACVRLLSEPAAGDELARRGWDLFRANYRWDAIAPAVERVLCACLAGPEPLTDRRSTGV
jgi:glycosyltransferase involved in cell wall biosynthesis